MRRIDYFRVMQHLPPTAEEQKDIKDFQQLENQMLKVKSLKRLYPQAKEVTESDWTKLQASGQKVERFSTTGNDLLVDDNSEMLNYLVKCSSGKILCAFYEKA